MYGKPDFIFIFPLHFSHWGWFVVTKMIIGMQPIARATQGVNSLFCTISKAIKTKATKAAETHEIVATRRNLRRYWVAFIWNSKMLNTCYAVSDWIVGYRIVLFSSRLR